MAGWGKPDAAKKSRGHRGKGPRKQVVITRDSRRPNLRHAARMFKKVFLSQNWNTGIKQSPTKYEASQQEIAPWNLLLSRLVPSFAI